MKTNSHYIEYIKEFKQKLRGTKIKGKRLFYIIELENMNAATTGQLKELKKLKREIPDWKFEADYYRTMYWMDMKRYFEK